MAALLAVGLWRIGALVVVAAALGAYLWFLSKWEAESRIRRVVVDQVKADLALEQHDRFLRWRARGGRLRALPSVGPRGRDERQAGPYRRKGRAS